MKRISHLQHEFVEHIPADVGDATLYISIPFATAIHKCCCGCGMEVVTPFSPTDWKLTFDGDSVSLNPSIGNWSFACQSHYWIERNTVNWAPRMTQREIDAGRAHDRLAKMRYYQANRPVQSAPSSASTQRSDTVWRRIMRRLFGTR